MAFKPPGLNFRLGNMRRVRSIRRQAWEEFVAKRKLRPSVPQVIARSWMRCWTLLDPHQKPTTSRLAADHLLSTQVANFNLISIARPIMEDLFQYIEGSGAVLMLTNAAGYILDLLGDEDLINLLRAQGIDRGTSLSENQYGTNAFALAILERYPTQVVESEHFLETMHQFADAAAPIFDIAGSPVGTLGVITLSQAHHLHTIGIAIGGARAIEGQRQSDRLVDEQNRQLAGLNAILSSIDEGILVWNSNGLVTLANPAASHVLDIPTDRMMGSSLEDFLTLPPAASESLARGETLTDVEAHILVNGQARDCLISIRYIPEQREQTGGKQVIAVLRKIQEIRQLVHRQVGAQAAFSLDNLVGQSPEMRRVRKVAETSAAARAPILIRGESGTGKNLLARAIHNQSNWRDGPFIVFACTTIPGELMMVELAGAEAGYDESVILSRPGKFELADSGTLFFKDIEALPLEAQTVLLNMMELGIAQRLGSRNPNEVQVRVIASTSANLERRVEEGNFRTDLYYRLSPFEIQLPPLRDRRGDLPILVENILERITRNFVNPIHLGEGMDKLLQSYHWPGNVRELEAVLQRAVVLAGSGPLLLPEHLPGYVRSPDRGEIVRYQVTPLSELERESILRAAKTCKGNLSQMARVLGISRTTVWRRLKEFDVSLEPFRHI